MINRFFDRSTRRITVSRDAIFCESSVTIEAIPATSKQSETEIIPNIYSSIEKEITDLPTESNATIESFHDSLSSRDTVTNFDGFEPPPHRSNHIRKPKIIQSFINYILSSPRNFALKGGKGMFIDCTNAFMA